MQKVAVSPNGDSLKKRVPSFTSAALALGGFALIAISAGCRETSAPPKAPAVQQGTTTTGVPDVLATVGDEKITMADIRARYGDDLDKLEMQYQLTKSRIINMGLDSVIRQKTVVAEAQKQGKTIDQLIAAEAPGGIEPTELDIAAWYKDNADRVPGRTLDQLRPQIADLLRSQRRQAAEKKLEDRIKTERKVAINYQPFRLQFTNGDAPAIGKKDAPITLVEFSDFQCPYCQRMAPVIKEVEQKYADKVRVVYRQYPIPSLHPFALKAAEASLCANEQGKFWEMHDAMFADQKKLSVSDLKETAQRLGMSEKKFSSCLDSGRYAEQVQNDSKEAVRSGVNGTPAVFVNGIVIDGGAVPFSVVETAIQKELSRSGASR
ncbi:MAG: thioredoxin domain-containing protein [Deltaproteobacteria bacterium]